MGHQMKMYITLVRNDLEQQCMHVVNTLQNFLLLVKAAVTEKKNTALWWKKCATVTMSR